MSHRHLLRSTSLLLACLLAIAGPLSGQAAHPVCALSTGDLRDMRLEGGTYGILFPVEMSARGDTVLVLGTSGVFNGKGGRVRVRGVDTATVGFLLTNGRHTVTAVPAPEGMATARYFRVRPGREGWEAVYFVPDRDAIPGTRFYDDGTLWYARLRAGQWGAVERIGRVQKTVTVRPNSAGLTRSGALSFAVFFGEPNGPGGVIVWRRVGDRKWRADTTALRFAPLTVSAISNATQPPDARFFPVSMIWGEERNFVGSLLSVDADKAAAPGIVRLGGDESMNDPVLYAVNDKLHVSWFELDSRKSPNLLYQALDPARENPGAGRQLVARGVNEFIFLAVPEGARTRLVWAYRPPDTMDSAEVAVMANGEPTVIGRVAFPFGFMTSGVASGDRSFILATSPRPVPDGEPSASRTLEVRVNCNEGT